jgi:hypothetical protein
MAQQILHVLLNYVCVVVAEFLLRQLKILLIKFICFYFNHFLLHFLQFSLIFFKLQLTGFNRA